MPNSKKLREMLDSRVMTQRELADKSGIDATYVNRMCNRHINAREDTLLSICDVLHCRVDEIIGDE